MPRHQGFASKNLQQSWNQLNRQFDAQILTRSIQDNINLKYEEFSKIRTAIAGILESNKTPSQMDAARARLMELQLRLDDWRKKYNDVAAENTRLSGLLKQLASTAGNRSAITSSSVAKAIPAGNREQGENNAPAMQVQAWQLRAEEEADKVRLRVASK